MKQDETQKFFQLLVKLEPEQFIGILKILGVSLAREDNAPKDFNDVYLELAEKWSQLPPKRRRNLLRLLSKI